MRLTPPSLVLAMACGYVVGGCGSSGAQPGPGAWIPRPVALIGITSDAARLGSPSVRVNVTASRKVRQIAAWIDQMKLVPRGTYNCPAAVVEPSVSFAFHASASSGVLARASETDDGSGSGPCNPLTLSITGEGRRELVAGMFLERVERLLEVDLGFGYGKIVGTLSAAGTPPVPLGSRTQLRRGIASGSYVNVSLADPRAFLAFGNIGVPVNRSGQFSIRLGPGTYLLAWAKGGRKPDCPPIKVIVRVGHTTHASVPVGCSTK